MLKILVTIGGIQAVAIVVGLVRSKLLAVLLGPAGVGVLSVIDQTVQLVAYVSAFSLPFASVKFLSLAHSQGPEAFRRGYASMFRLLLAFTSAGAALALAVALLHPALLGLAAPGVQGLLIPALISVPVMALNSFCSSVLAAAQRARAAAAVSVAGALLLTVGAVIGITLHGAAGYYWGNLAALLLVVLGATAYMRRRLGVSVFDRGDSIRAAVRANRGIVTLAVAMSASSLMLSFSYLVARTTILRQFGAADAGLLQAAIALAAALGLVLSPMNGLYLTPILNRDLPRAAKVRAALAFQRRQIVIITLLALPISLFPQVLVSLLYSPAFAPVARVVFLFVLAQCILLLAGVAQALLIGLDDLIHYGLNAVAGYGCLAALAWLLGPRFGLAGIGLAFLGGSLVTFALSYARLARLTGLALPRPVWAALAYALAAVLVAGLLFRAAAPWQPALLAARAAVLVTLAAGLLAFLDASERAALRRLARSLAHRFSPTAPGAVLAGVEPTREGRT